MSRRNYLTVGFKDIELLQLDSALPKLAITEAIKALPDVWIETDDLREVFAGVSAFLKENSLEDENPFFNEFTIDPYGVMVDIHYPHNYIYTDVLEMLVFSLGKYLSSAIQTDCIVLFENMFIPVGLFQKGVLVNSFGKYSATLLANKIWVPNVR